LDRVPNKYFSTNKLLPGVYMKSFFMSLLFLCAISATAQEPIFAKLQVDGISQNMTEINPKFSLVTEGELMIDGSTVALNLTKSMPECPEGMFCPQIMPSNVVVFLTLVKVVHTECSTKFYAETSGDVSNPLHERVVVEDYSNSTCERLVRTPGVITYTATQTDKTAAARFFVQGGFVRN
jgi:hypothetical protein